MDKQYIKNRLRESLELLNEDKEDNETDKEIQYDDITNFFDKHPSIKMVGVFREAGFSEDDIYTRLPYKKLRKEKNEMGGTYSFSKEEADRLRTVITKYPGGGKKK